MSDYSQWAKGRRAKNLPASRKEYERIGGDAPASGGVLPVNRGTGWRDMDRDRCPEGADPDLWHLTLLFQQKAEEDEIRLDQGRSIIYAALKKSLEKAGIMTRPVPYTAAQLDLAFEHLAWCNMEGELPPPLLEVTVYPLSGPLWRRVVELMMTEFWTRHWNSYALDEFCEHTARFGLEYQFATFERRMASQSYKDAWVREVAGPATKDVSCDTEGN